MPLSCHPGPEEGRESEGDISWHIEERGLLLRESKVVDDDAAESLESSVGNVDGDVEAEQDPCPGIIESLARLVPLPFSIGNSSLVLGKALDDVVFLSLVQEFGIHRGVGEVPQNEQGPSE